MKKWLARLLYETEGQDLIEYALLGGTIALGVTLVMQGLRGALRNEFNTISTTLGS
jgi:Flp pilus assembly pilin Flp